MPFKEDLPVHLVCPPEDAVEDKIAEAFRMVYTNPPIDKDFLSKKALGEAMLGDDECGHASCSLNAKALNAIRLAQMPKPREKGAMVAKVSIPAGSGKWTMSKKKHIHFWMYDTFDHTAAFVEMVDF
ncbi:hypothetical protein [Mesorhizobium sp. M0013]|uniref:hypothetical protein n=1 Tax=Mesorhizobium sp. M0013 TaxID=2956841 RepID=UPI00333A44CE